MNKWERLKALIELDIVNAMEEEQSNLLEALEQVLTHIRVLERLEGEEG